MKTILSLAKVRWFLLDDLKDDEIEKIDCIIDEFAEKEDRADDAVLQLVKKIKGDKFEDGDILRDILYINKHQ